MKKAFENSKSAESKLLKDKVVNLSFTTTDSLALLFKVLNTRLKRNI